MSALHTRGLSLIGKIQVVNSLIASLFVYKMMVLPNIPKRTIKNIDNVIRNYIWGGKKAKIAYSTLQNPKDQGGLNLVNLQKKEISLKATWPVILQQEQEYATTVYNTMRCITIKFDIWRCTLLPQDVKYLKISSDFWSDVLASWGEYNFFHNKRIENQFLWYNSHIRIKDKPFMWKDSYLRDLKYVCQLFEQGDFKPQNIVYEEYGLTKLRYNSLKKAIPKDWKLYFTTQPAACYMPMPPHNIDMAANTTKLSSQIYKYISGDITLIVNKYKQWDKELGQELCQDIFQYGAEHKHLNRITNVPKFFRPTKNWPEVKQWFCV